MTNGKAIRIPLIDGSIKKISYKMSYFLEPYTHSKNKIKVGFYLPSYAKKILI